MSKPRTPENFPRMKVRGGQRRRDARFRQAWRGVRAINWSSIGQVFDGMAAVLTEAGKAAVRMRVAITASWHMAIRRERDRWVATHQLPAAPSPYAAPITKD